MAMEKHKKWMSGKKHKNGIKGTWGNILKGKRRSDKEK